MDITGIDLFDQGTCTFSFTADLMNFDQVNQYQ